MTDAGTDGISEEYKCVVCGSDLTDPKNAGDPDENGDWVCFDMSCRAVHDVQMMCDRVIAPKADINRIEEGEK